MFVGETAPVDIESVEPHHETHLLHLLIHRFLLLLSVLNLPNSIRQDLGKRVLLVLLADLVQVVHHCVLQLETHYGQTLLLILSHLDFVLDSKRILLLKNEVGLGVINEVHVEKVVSAGSMLSRIKCCLERWVNPADIKQDIEGQIVVGDRGEALDGDGGGALRQEVVAVEDGALGDVLDVHLRGAAVNLLLDSELAVIDDDHLVDVSVGKGVVSLVKICVFVGLIGNHVHCDVSHHLLSDAFSLQVVNLLEHSKQEDLEFIIIVLLDIFDKVGLHNFVVGQELIEVVLFEVSALTVLLGLDGGRATTSEKQRHLAEKVTRA